MKKISYKSLVCLNVAGFIGTILVNALANLIPLNGYTTGQVSAMYPTLFTPASFTFSIWIAIYALLGYFSLYQLLELKKGREVQLVKEIGLLFFVASAANMLWIIVWHYKMIALSMAVMVVLLTALKGIYTRVSFKGVKAQKIEEYLSGVGFRIYLGWISVATIANAAVFLTSIGWNRWRLEDAFWTAFVMALAVYLTLRILKKYGDIYYSLVTLWAFFGIYIERIQTANINGNIIASTALIGGLFVLLGIAGQLIRRLFTQDRNTSLKQ